MTTENNDVDKKVVIKKVNDKPPQSIASELQKTPKKTEKSFFKTPTFYGLVAFIILVFILIIWALLFAGNDTAPQTAAIDQQTAEEMRQEDAAMQAKLEAEQQPLVDPLLASIPPDDFIFSPQPVQALASQSTDNLISELPDFVDNGTELLAPDGTYMPINSPYVTQSMAEVYNMVEGYITTNRLLDLRNADGVDAWYIRIGQGFEDADYVPLKDPTASAEIRQNMRRYAAAEMRTKLLKAPWLNRQQVPQAGQQPFAAVDPALTVEERERLLSMVDTQRSNNLDLVRENKNLRNEKNEIKNTVVNLVQRIEDSPKINANLRATMIPKESGWKVTAVVGDRIYLTNSEGVLITLAQGDKLPNSELLISHADENTGLVLVTPAN